ncbi:hypothetical protein LAWI1_G005942, partial [Lachnellula willkommii]
SFHDNRDTKKKTWYHRALKSPRCNQCRNRDVVSPQRPNPSPKLHIPARTQYQTRQSIADFTTFMHAWCVILEGHHHTEETVFFPWLEEYIGIEN